MKKTFHFDLRHGTKLSVTSEKELFLSIAGVNFPILRHTKASLASIKNNAVEMIHRSEPKAVTHYCEFPQDALPERETILMEVVSKIKGDPNYDLPELHGFWYQLPERSKLRWARKRHKKLQGLAKAKDLVHPKLATFNCDVDGHLKTNNSVEDAATLFSEADEFKTPYDTAVGILFQHPELAKSKGYTASIVINDHIAPSPSIDASQYNRVMDLATEISKQGPATKDSGWARIQQDKTPEGELMYAEFDLTDENGDVVYRKGDPMMAYQMTNQTESKIGSAISNALRTSRDDSSLENQTWSGPQGTTAETSIVADTASPNNASPMLASAPSVTFTATNRTPHHGLDIYPDSIDFDPANNSFAMDVKNLYLRSWGAM